MDDLQARTQAETAAIASILSEMTGLPSRWSGRVELVPNAEFKGRKRQICDIQIDAALAAQDERWPTLIHENLHSISAGYNVNDFRDYRGWEEGVAEQLQRMFRPVILERLNMVLPDTAFSAEESHGFNDYIAALESLRLLLKKHSRLMPLSSGSTLICLGFPSKTAPTASFASFLLCRSLSAAFAWPRFRRRTRYSNYGYSTEDKTVELNSSTELSNYAAHLEARRRVSDQVLQANTLPEIEAAKQVLRDWLKAHPDEQGMRDGFEQLYTIQEIIENEDARRAAGEIIPLPPPERKRILTQATDARTLPEKQWAAYELWDWQRRNPEDAGICAAMKGLPRIDDEEEQEAGRTQKSRLPVEAGQAA